MVPPKCTQTLTGDSSIVLLFFFRLNPLERKRERERGRGREVDLTSYLAGIQTLDKYRMQLQTATRAVSLNPAETRDKRLRCAFMQ